MKKLIAGILAIIFLTVSMYGSVSAAEIDADVGDVLFHQDFSAEIGKGLGEYGLRFGSAGSQPEEMALSDGKLYLKTGNSRLYLLLADVDKADTFTGEFTFRFVEPENSNAYIAFMLTCRGDEPTNISSVVIRAGGTVDEFSEPTEKIKAAISSGETVNVKIPIESGALSEMTLTSGGESCTLKRSDVLLVSSGSNGFIMRNTGVELDEIYIVHGAHYAVKTGYYADASYSAADAEREMNESSGEFAPETGEDGAVLASVLLAVCAAFFGKRRRVGLRF